MTINKNNPPVLVPVDFSENSEAALVKACELAECMKAPVIVLHVVHDPAEMPGYYSRIAGDEQLMRIEDLAKKMFDEFIAEVVKKHPEVKSLKKIETMLVTGIPVTRILQVIEKIEPAMVVMGSQGRTGLEHVMLGSKAEQVVKLCPVPITIVKQKK